MLKPILAISLVTTLTMGMNVHAQTYNATTGTNGTTDIQSDYAESTGDGASVSVDVPLEFELPKKLIIALHDGQSISSHPSFSGQTIPSWDITKTSAIFDGSADPSFPDRTNAKLSVFGLIYTNAENASLRVDLDNYQLAHELDSNLTVELQCSYKIKSLDGAFTSHMEYLNDATGNNDLAFNSTDLATTDNVGKLSIYCWGLQNSFEQGNLRAGKYLGNMIVTTSLL